MYSSLFCRVYDALGWNYYPEAFGEQLLDWLRLRGVPVGRSLDLACGTGVLCDALQRGGWDARGADISADMIAIARGRFPQVPFEVADMTQYRPDGAFRLVTCTGDALNHLSGYDDLEKALRVAWNVLEPGGWFVFDLLDEREIPSGEPFEVDYEGAVVRFYVDRAPDGRVLLNIDLLEGGERTLHEVIEERLYDPGDVCAALMRLGFGISQRGDRLIPGAGPGGNTCIIAAQKPETAAL